MCKKPGVGNAMHLYESLERRWCHHTATNTARMRYKNIAKYKATINRVAFNVTAVTAGGAATEGARCGNSAQLLKVTAVKWRSRSVLVYSTVFDTLEGIIN